MQMKQEAKDTKEIEKVIQRPKALSVSGTTEDRSVTMTRPVQVLFIAGVVALLLAAPALAGDAAGIGDRATIRAATERGDDPIRHLVNGESAVPIAGSEPPSWVGPFVLVLGALLGGIWLGAGLISVFLNGVANRGDPGDLPPLRVPEEGRTGPAGITPRADRRQRPSPRSTDWR
jgi:hypothetical protein